MQINGDSPLINEIYFDVLDSTQLYAREIAFDLLKIKKHWHVIRANRQTSGIGQADRKWTSPLGNIYVTFIIPLEPEDLPMLQFLPLMSTKSVCQTLESQGLKPEIKWVNDVLVNNKKISGVLVETVCQGLDLWALVGIGINVSSKEELACVDQPVTSIFMEKGDKSAMSVLEIFQELKAHLYSNFRRLRGGSNSRDEMIEYFRKHSAYLGKIVKILGKKADPPSDINYGIFRGITDEGYLILYDGIEGKVYNDGRIFYVRNSLVGEWIGSKSNSNGESILTIEEDNLNSLRVTYKSSNKSDNKVETCISIGKSIKANIATYSKISYISFYGKERDTLNTGSEYFVTWSGEYSHVNDEINSFSITFENLSPNQVTSKLERSKMHRKNEIFKRFL